MFGPEWFLNSFCLYALAWLLSLFCAALLLISVLEYIDLAKQAETYCVLHPLFWRPMKAACSAFQTLILTSTSRKLEPSRTSMEFVHPSKMCTCISKGKSICLCPTLILMFLFMIWLPQSRANRTTDPKCLKLESFIDLGPSRYLYIDPDMSTDYILSSTWHLNYTDYCAPNRSHPNDYKNWLPTCAMFKPENIFKHFNAYDNNRCTRNLVLDFISNFVADYNYTYAAIVPETPIAKFLMAALVIPKLYDIAIVYFNASTRNIVFAVNNESKHEIRSTSFCIPPILYHAQEYQGHIKNLTATNQSCSFNNASVSLNSHFLSQHYKPRYILGNFPFTCACVAAYFLTWWTCKIWLIVWLFLLATQDVVIAFDVVKLYGQLPAAMTINRTCAVGYNPGAKQFKVSHIAVNATLHHANRTFTSPSLHIPDPHLMVTGCIADTPDLKVDKSGRYFEAQFAHTNTPRFLDFDANTLGDGIWLESPKIMQICTGSVCEHIGDFKFLEQEADVIGLSARELFVDDEVNVHTCRAVTRLLNHDLDLDAKVIALHRHHVEKYLSEMDNNTSQILASDELDQLILYYSTIGPAYDRSITAVYLLNNTVVEETSGIGDDTEVDAEFDYHADLVIYRSCVTNYTTYIVLCQFHGLYTHYKMHRTYDNGSHSHDVIDPSTITVVPKKYDGPPCPYYLSPYMHKAWALSQTQQVMEEVFSFSLHYWGYEVATALLSSLLMAVCMSLLSRIGRSLI